MAGGHKTCVFCDQHNLGTRIWGDDDENDNSWVSNKVLMGSQANKKL